MPSDTSGTWAPRAMRTIGHHLRPIAQLLPRSAEQRMRQYLNTLMLMFGRAGLAAGAPSRRIDANILARAIGKHSDLVGGLALVVGQLEARSRSALEVMAQVDVLDTNPYDPRVTILADPRIDGAIPYRNYDLCVLAREQVGHWDRLVGSAWDAIRPGGLLFLVGPNLVDAGGELQADLLPRPILHQAAFVELLAESGHRRPGAAASAHLVKVHRGPK